MSEVKKRCMDCKFIEGEVAEEGGIAVTLWCCLRKTREVEPLDAKCPHFENKEVTS